MDRKSEAHFNEVTQIELATAAAGQPFHLFAGTPEILKSVGEKYDQPVWTNMDDQLRDLQQEANFTQIELATGLDSYLFSFSTINDTNSSTIQIQIPV